MSEFTLVNKGALKLAVNVLQRAGKDEVVGSLLSTCKLPEEVPRLTPEQLYECFDIGGKEFEKAQRRPRGQQLSESDDLMCCIARAVEHKVRSMYE